MRPAPLAMVAGGVLALAACAGGSGPSDRADASGASSQPSSEVSASAPVPTSRTARPDPRTPPPRPPISDEPSPAVAREASGRLQRRVDALSLRQLSHQVQVVTVAGRVPTRVGPSAAAANQTAFGLNTPAEVAERFQPGGIVYFDDNVSSVPQVRSLSSGLHRASRRGGVPTLLFTDQEGGLVSRLPGPASTAQPAARELDGDPTAGLASARAVGQEMAEMGLDVDFAPVADVDTVGGAGVIGDRAFGTEAAVVARMVRAQTCGYHRGGVGVSLKHWPGHGSTSVDSHLALPTLMLSRSSWERDHLPPFVAGIGAGADLVMTGHLAYPRLDPTGRPATLSRELTTGWLRDRLDFDGVIVTDALEMDALAEWGTPGEVAVQALQAGADLLLMSPSPRGAAAGIRAAVADGELTRARLEQSVLRVLTVKDATGLLTGPRELDRCRG